MKLNAILLTGAAVALMTTRAHADEHHMRVSEIFLADPTQGDAVQFVELSDPAGEPFPEEDYHLGIYDTAGVLLATVVIDPPPGTRRYLVATPAAEKMFGVEADALLTETLPTEGQVCFEVVEDGENEVIACLAYGCVESRIEPEFTEGIAAAPLDGMSMQLQLGGQLFDMAAPTPGAGNIAGTSVQAGCAPPDDEEPPPDDDEEPPPDDEEPPIVDDGDDGGCAVAGGSSSGLALIALGLLIGRQRRRRGARR